MDLWEQYILDMINIGSVNTLMPYYTNTNNLH